MLRVGLDSTFHLGGVVLTGSQLIITGTAGALLLGFCAMLWATNIGLCLRALADNPVQFALFGSNADAHRLIAFAFDGALAADEDYNLHGDDVDAERRNQMNTLRSSFAGESGVVHPFAQYGYTGDCHDRGGEPPPAIAFQWPVRRDIRRESTSTGCSMCSCKSSTPHA